MKTKIILTLTILTATPTYAGWGNAVRGATNPYGIAVGVVMGGLIKRRETRYKKYVKERREQIQRQHNRDLGRASGITARDKSGNRGTYR